MKNKEEFIQEIVAQALKRNLISILSDNGSIYYADLTSFAKFVKGEQGYYEMRIYFTEEFEDRLKELEVDYKLEKDYGMSESIVMRVAF